VTDLIFENPNGDTGTITIERVPTDGSTPPILFEQSLENFREFDLHFVAQLVFKAGEQFQVLVDCNNPEDDNGVKPACTDSVTFAGFLKKTGK
jgi:hypothetical protein